MKKRKWSAEEVQHWYATHNPVVYANKEDGNIVVRKARSDGWTVNWANPMAYVLQGGILAAVFGLIHLLN